MKNIKSIFEGISSQGKMMGSRGSSFRDSSSSSDETSGLSIGASRAKDHEDAAKRASITSEKTRKDEIEKRNKKAKQRQKETMQMSQEETVTEAKHIFHVHLHPIDTRLGKMVDDKTVEPIGNKPKGDRVKLTVPATDTRSARNKVTRYVAQNFGPDNVKSIEYKGLHTEETVTEANIGPNVDTETIRGIHQRAHARISDPLNKNLTYSHPGFADSIDNEYKARKELAKRGIKVDRPKHRAVIESNLDEAIKGWKNAASDIRKFRSAASDAKKSAVLVSLKKDGSESAMHDAKSYHASEEEARKKHDTITKLNPTRKIRHNLYVDDKKVATLGEETNTEKREKIKNVARMDDAEPTSENSTLGKTGSIKKIIEEKPTMSVPNFGLSASLIAAARQIVEKKDDVKLTGGKTQVEVDPKIKPDDRSEDTDPKTDKEKKLAALASPKDKITRKDVLVGRGVLNKEEVEQLDENLQDWSSKHEKVGNKITKNNKTATYHAFDKNGKHVDSYTASHKMKEEVELDERENSPYEKASDTALDKQYGYGTSFDKTSKTSFGRAANRSSAAYALRTLRKNPNTDTETGSDAVHQGWAKTATTNADQTPEKKAKRAALASTPYSKLPDDEKEKDRVAFNAIKKVFNKEDEQLDELSKKTLKRYIDAASDNAATKAYYTGKTGDLNTAAEISKRIRGIQKATKLITQGDFSADELARIDEIAQAIFEIGTDGLDPNKKYAKGDVTNAVLSDEKKPEMDDQHKHPMQQLEKIAHSIEGREPHFEHKDGSKTKVGKSLARQLKSVHDSMKTTQEKNKFADSIHASRDSMRAAANKHL